MGFQVVSLGSENLGRCVDAHVGCLIKTASDHLVRVCCSSPEPDSDWRTLAVQPWYGLGRYEGTEAFRGRGGPQSGLLPSLPEQR
jgi:hypothetical protein